MSFFINATFQAGQRKPVTWRMFQFASVFELVSTWGFVQSFATQPTQSEFFHAFPYVMFLFGLMAAGMSTIAYYKLVPGSTPRFWRMYQLAFLVLQSANVACASIVVLNAYLLDGGGIWAVGSSFGGSFGTIVFQGLFITNFVMPMILLFAMEKYAVDVQVIFRRDTSSITEESLSVVDRSSTLHVHVIDAAAPPQALVGSEDYTTDETTY